MVRSPRRAVGSLPRRDRVIEVALDMFGRYGTRRTSIEEIAAEARIAKGSIYLEFRSKEALFHAVAERVATEMLTAAAEAASGPQALEERLTAILVAKFWRLYDLVHARPHAGELIATKDEVAADVFRRADDRFAEILAGALAAAVDRGEWKPARSGTVHDVASLLLRAAHGNAYGSAGRALSAERYRQRLRFAVEVILAGSARR